MLPVPRCPGSMCPCRPQPCHQVVDPEPFLELCLADACTCRDGQRCLCPVLAAYARECAREGTELSWRNQSGCGQGAGWDGMDGRGQDGRGEGGWVGQDGTGHNGTGWDWVGQDSRWDGTGTGWDGVEEDGTGQDLMEWDGLGGHGWARVWWDGWEGTGWDRTGPGRAQQDGKAQEKEMGGVGMGWGGVG